MVSQVKKSSNPQRKSPRKAPEAVELEQPPSKRRRITPAEPARRSARIAQTRAQQKPPETRRKQSQVQPLSVNKRGGKPTRGTKAEAQAQVSPAKSKPAKRKRVAEQQISSAKRNRSFVDIPPREPTAVDEFVEGWFDKIPGSPRGSLVEQAASPPPDIEEMPPKKNTGLPSPDESGGNSVPTSQRSSKSTANVHDADYRKSLALRNIFIQKRDPPVELVQQARRILSRSRDSPEMDDGAIEALRRSLRKLEDADEDKVEQKLAGQLLPSSGDLPDDRLEVALNQMWHTRVPVSLKSGLYKDPLPLPKPKPDVVFGYSEGAFSEGQNAVMDLLVDDVFGLSYAVPCQDLRFPFLSVEFKSQAKGGTNYIALNQVAGAGAIAMNNLLELRRRSFGVESFNFEEPQFFSVTMDQELARVNVHWVSKPQAEDAGYGFHVEALSKHLLEDPAGLRALHKAIKNVLDEGTGTHLKNLCDALDKYKEIVDQGQSPPTSKPDDRARELMPPPPRSQEPLLPVETPESSTPVAGKGRKPRVKGAPKRNDGEATSSQNAARGSKRSASHITNK